MITLKEILSSQSNVLENARVKLVRHKDNRLEYRDVIKDRQKLLTYQNKQPSKVFIECDYIVSFIGIERSRAVLLGVWKVNGYTISGKDFCYDLEPISDFDDLIDRLVINWGNGAIAWNQWYDKQPKEVVEILPKGYIGHFPGLLNIVLEFDELKRLTGNPEANYEWHHQLAAVNGVYMILDNKTGRQYIGSAYGKKGIWQRWCEYAKTYHGGNKELKMLLESDPNYCRHFRYSVLQTLPSNITSKETIAIEALYKQKLGSKAHGLNCN